MAVRLITSLQERSKNSQTDVPRNHDKITIGTNCTYSATFCYPKPHSKKIWATGGTLSGGPCCLDHILVQIILFGIQVQGAYYEKLHQPTEGELCMGKPPPEEHFVISVKCPKPQLGDAMSGIAKMGLEVTGCELQTTIRTFNKQPRQARTALDFLVETFLPTHPTFRAKDAVVHGDLHGRTAGAIYSALKMLVEDGKLVKPSDGNYARADVKQITAQKKGAMVAKKTDAMTNSAFLLKFANRHGGKLDRTAAREALAADGRNAASISSVIRDLLKASRIERVEEGTYRVLKPTLNGAEAANG